MLAGTSKALEDKLAKHVKVPLAGCWLWLGAVDKDGYGVIAGTVDNVGWRDKAHRLAYSHWVGQIPKGMHVLHRCDVPGCINPAHLYLGDPAANGRDKAVRGRARSVPQFGAANPMYGKTGVLNPFFGKRHTPEAKAKISAANRKKVFP